MSSSRSCEPADARVRYFPAVRPDEALERVVGTVEADHTVVLTNLDLEEQTRIWEALNEPYRLSVCYKVRVTTIDSARRVELADVVDSQKGFGSPEN